MNGPTDVKPAAGAAGDEARDNTAKHTTKRQGRGGQKSIDLIDAAIRILEEIQPATVRAVCYRLFVEKLIDSMEKANTNKVSRLLVQAREEGGLPWEWIVDETREAECVNTWANPQEIIDATVEGYR